MAEKKKKASNSSMRLDKFLVEMGKGSRSQIKEMAKKGRIQVNGTVIKATDGKIDPEKDVVLLDGQPVSYAHTEYFMLNKPAGTVSATEDGKYPTVISLIDAALRKDLFPVGRLDLDTEGLLLITNDGAMAHELLSPKKHVDKIYLAYIEGTLPKDAKKQSPLPNRTIVVAHEAFGYLCDAYGLTQVGIEGLSPDSEPDPGRMAEVIDFVREHSISTIFFEELVSPKVAEAIASETGAQAKMLSPLEGLSDEQAAAGADYFSVMHDNLAALMEALK